MTTITITPGQLSLKELREISRNHVELALDTSAIANIEKISFNGKFDVSIN